MIRNLLFISIAPVLIVAMYIYIRDKYEKEPLLSLIKALFAGVFISLPVVFIEKIIMGFGTGLSVISAAVYNGFVVASLTEEGFKYITFILLFWSNRHFNEKFDGIVYAVYISLGFAAIENLLYVYAGGYQVGILRAITAVPAHSLFATVMGYHFSYARFYPEKRMKHLVLALLIPLAWHGLYDFLILGKKEIFLIIFIPVVIWFWINGLKKINELSMASVFRNDFFLNREHSENKLDDT